MNAGYQFLLDKNRNAKLYQNLGKLFNSEEECCACIEQIATYMVIHKINLK